MTDLQQTASVFAVSAKLGDASAAMDRLANGQPPSESDKEVFCWAGRLLEQMDWSCEVKTPSGPQGSLAVEATATRPAFYASLLQMVPEFEGEGIKGEGQVYAALKEVYGLLVSGGNNFKSVAASHRRLGARLLRVLSKGLLVTLTNNGLPRSSTPLTV